MSPPFLLCRRLPFFSAVASLSSLPSPPFRLCRRLPFVSAVASLCSSAVVARALLVIYPLKTRHHDASYHNTTINDSTTTVYGQPVNQSTADNQFTTDAPQAIALQTTTLQLHSKGTAGAPQTYRRRTADADADADADNNNLNNNHNTQTHRRCTADAPQMHRRRRQQQPPTIYHTVDSWSTTDNHHQLTTDVPQAIALQTTTTIQAYYRCTKGGYSRGERGRPVLL